jgi:Leucine-rich repeat (LRR) protein
MKKGNKIKKQIGLFVLLISFISSHALAQVPLLDSLTLDTLTAFTSIEDALKDPDKVIKLELRKKKLKEFPVEILKFKNLQYLDLSKNNIKELPPEIDSLQNLQIFIISKNELESLPKEIGELHQLQYLNANNNELSSLPVQIANLSNLKNLDLWSNNVDKFPSEMKYLKNLKVMDLRVILIPDAEQQRVQEMLPWTKIYFSPYCKCAQ